MAEKKLKKVEEPEVTKIELTTDILQSIDILIQCANIAQKGGLLSLQDASYANQAVNILGQFLPKPEAEEQPENNVGNEESK